MEAQKREEQKQAQQVINVTEEMKRAPLMHETVPPMSAEPQKVPDEKVQVQQQPVARKEEVKAVTSPPVKT